MRDLRKINQADGNTSLWNSDHPPQGVLFPKVELLFGEADDQYKGKAKQSTISVHSVTS